MINYLKTPPTSTKCHIQPSVDRTIEHVWEGTKQRFYDVVSESGVNTWLGKLTLTRERYPCPL